MMLNTARGWMGRTVVLGAAAGVLGAMFAGGCSSMPPANGPTVGVRNDSDASLRATFWIGDRSEQRPGERADMRAQETMEIPPYGTKQFRLGAFSGYDSPTTSFVRVQIQPVGPSFVSQPQYWYEVNPPSPYTIRVHGMKPKLEFDRAGAGTIVMIPPELWFHNATTTAMAVTGAASATSKPAVKVVGQPNRETMVKPATGKAGTSVTAVGE